MHVTGLTAVFMVLFVMCSSAESSELQPKNAACRKLGGRCLRIKEPWPDYVCTDAGAPYCYKRRRCCYPACSKGHCNVDCEQWCYPSKNWPYTCNMTTKPIPGFCNGNSQSPIDLCSESAINASGSLIFSPSYNVPIAEIYIKNNGHTVGASWASDLPARTISGGGLDGSYTLAQFHFHWGCENDRGSEHVVDGTRYAMELHLVHYKTSYGNLSNAINSNYKDAVAVLGVFFDVGAVVNSALTPITDSLSIPYYSISTIAFGKALQDFIPPTQTFYRYQGSLTTPTCNEVVIWSVFSTPLTISQDQIEAFRSLKDKEDCQLCDNYRGIQPLNGRKVEKYTYGIWLP